MYVIFSLKGRDTSTWTRGVRTRWSGIVVSGVKREGGGG